ncbi:MAG: sugar isomerase [Streptosporangiaceae bacterium]|jgi:fructoselysine-6-P-deglycase FrlB-like protein|nr:sugar isomerase [Streptosporangiaceae bacterium]
MTAHMDYYQAVASQPAKLAASAAAVTSALAGLDLSPWRTGVLAVASMGAGAHAGHALVHRLARAGRRAVNIDASDLISLGAGADIADSYVFISEGGRSRETVEAAALVPPGARLGITNAPSAPISGVVDALVGLEHGEDSRVYTVGYTATLQAFGLLATAIDGQDAADQWASLPELVQVTLDELADAAAHVAPVLSKARSIDFVGSGSSRASVTEAALLFRESTRISTASYETYQYLHGPMECLTSEHACVLLGEDREVALARYLARAGVTTVLITSESVEQEEGLSVLPIRRAPDPSRGILQILPAQLIAGELARLRGLGIDGFLYHQDDTKIDQLRPATAG